MVFLLIKNEIAEKCSGALCNFSNSYISTKHTRDYLSEPLTSLQRSVHDLALLFDFPLYSGFSFFCFELASEGRRRSCRLLHTST